MKLINLRQFALAILAISLVAISATSCSKASDQPGIPTTKDYGTHNIDTRLQGQWLWTSGSDGGYYNENGTWTGGQYGFAWRLSVDAKGNGTLYSHIFSDLGSGSKLSVDIYYTGYYEMDGNKNLKFYSMGGRYVSSSGTDRALSGDEIYNASSGTGRTISFPAISFTTINGRQAFTSTSSGQTEPFFKQ